MKKNQIFIKGLLIIFALVIFGNPITTYAQNSLDNKTLVTIGNEDITVGEFMHIYTKNNTQTGVQEPSSIEDYLNLFINFKLKVREATDMQLDTNSEFKKELAGYREQLAKPYFVDESVNDALLQEAYNRKLRDIRASHILLMVDENAKPEDTLEAYNEIVQIREEIIAGKDFGEAAIEYSEDPSARDREEIPGKQRYRKGNRGDLGYFTVFNMVYPFENAAYNTPIGQVSQPIRTKFGYHLVMVSDNKDALGTAQVAHIFASLNAGTATDEEIIAKKEKIDNIYLKIQEGMPFEDAVTQYSEDKGSARNGGKLSAFTCNRVVPEFVLAAESLEIDGVSEPVQTLYGYHIIKLISRETPGTFDEESEKLKERLKKDDRSHKSEEVVLQRIKDDNNLKIYDKNKLAVISQIDTSVLVGTFKADSFAAYLKPVMKIGKDKLSQFDFAKYVEENHRKQQNLDKDVYLENMFTTFVNENCLAYEDKHLEEHFPDFKALMREYHDGILLFNLTDEKVWTKAVKDTLGLENYFNEHNDNYLWNERVDATIYQIKKEEDREKVKALIVEYESDGDIAQQLDKDSIQSVKIIPGKFEKGDNQYIDKVEWVSGNIQETSSDVENLITIVKIKEVLSPQPKQFNEARGLATADYQGYLEEQWIKQLKETYPVVINEEILKLTIASQ